MEIANTDVKHTSSGRKVIDVTLRKSLAGVERPDSDPMSSSSDSDMSSDPFGCNDLDGKQGALESSTLPTTKDAGRGDGNGNQSHAEDGNTHSNECIRQENKHLTAEVANLKQQIYSMQIKLEALAPVPGLDVSAVENALLERDDEDHDVRDVKIVHQAKTIRTLKRSVQREKHSASKAMQRSKELETENQKLADELETANLKLQRMETRAAASRNMFSDSALQMSKDDTNNTDTSSEDNNRHRSLRSKCDELKLQNETLQQELKKTQRALLKEVGEGFTLDDLIRNTDANALANARRGRAEQILTLKSRVKKLKAELAAVKSNQSLAANEKEVETVNFYLPAPSTGNDQNVDKKAHLNLAARQAARQHQVDDLEKTNESLQQKLQQLTKKKDAARSRVSILEQEKAELKERFQVVITKSQNDDALIEALQKQLGVWKIKIHELKRARTADGGSTTDRAELDRLRKLVADYQRGVTSSNNKNGNSMSMPPQSEVTQFRVIATEKERLADRLRTLQSQLQEKEEQIRALKADSTSKEFISGLKQPTVRLPPVPSRPSSSDRNEVETIRQTMRESLQRKEDEIQKLTAQLQTSNQETSSNLYQVIKEREEQNVFLRQELDKLKTKYAKLKKGK